MEREEKENLVVGTLWNTRPNGSNQQSTTYSSSPLCQLSVSCGFFQNVPIQQNTMGKQKRWCSGCKTVEKMTKDFFPFPIMERTYFQQPPNNLLLFGMSVHLPAVVVYPFFVGMNEWRLYDPNEGYRNWLVTHTMVGLGIGSCWQPDVVCETHGLTYEIVVCS